MKKFSRGFTIIQLAIILTVLAVALLAYLSLSSGKSQHRVFADNRSRGAYIMQSILQAVVNNLGYIPCPAVGTLASSNASYGVADCINTDQNGTLRAGTIPFITLGMDPARYYLDPYGNAYTYVMDSNFSTVATFSSNTTGGITLNNQDGTTTNPVLLLISHGQNGTGAFISGSGNVVNNTMVTDAQELNNARCGGGWTNRGLTIPGGVTCNGQFYNAAPNIYGEQKSLAFDDVVQGLTKEQITNPVGSNVGPTPILCGVPQTFIISCDPPTTPCQQQGNFTFTLGSTETVTLNYAVAPGHCTEVQVTPNLNGTPLAQSGIFGYIGDPHGNPMSGTLFTQSLPAGAYTINLEAVIPHTAPGCNDAPAYALGRWGGTITLTCS